jgi:hypothetical protein
MCGPFASPPVRAQNQRAPLKAAGQKAGEEQFKIFAEGYSCGSINFCDAVYLRVLGVVRLCHVTKMDSDDKKPKSRAPDVTMMFNIDKTISMDG